MQRWRWPGALLLMLLVLGSVLGLALFLIYDPPFLTWQHAADLAPALEQYAADVLPGGPALQDGVSRVEVERVRAYTDECSVVRARIRSAGSDYVFWALLYRVEDVWQVTLTQPEGGLSALLVWGDPCAEPEPVIPPLDLPPLD